MVLGIVARELTYEWRVQNGKRRFMGSWSDNAHVCEVMRCTGIIKHLQIERFAASARESEQFEMLEFMQGFRSSQQKGSSAQEHSAQNLAEYFVNCFKRLGLELTRQAEGDMIELIGEVMDNAERHSGRNEWWAQAYFDQHESPDHGMCHVAIVSLGSTFAESLRNGQNAEETRRRIDELINAHKRGEWFGLREPLTEESLLTFYALQDGVSCTTKPGAGSGTVRLIEHFQQLSRPDSEGIGPLMTVISGSTQILFDRVYRMQEVDGRKIITFNAANSLEEPPSANNVRRLRFCFPGSLIALRFHMERSYLQQLETLFRDKD